MTPEERARCLRVAEDALEASVVGRAPVPVPGEDMAPLSEPGACFVTLEGPGDVLRGCIGTLEARRALAEEIRAMTAAAALRDPRFMPVQPAELPHLSVSLSILGPMRRVADASQIAVGEHGLLVRRGPYQGVLLPQVAVEQGWDAERFVRETLRKAGLRPEDATDPDLELRVFNAEVF